MRARRFVAPVLVGLTLALLSGCSDSTSPAARQWERSAANTRTARSAAPQGPLVAHDGLGTVIFTPDATTDSSHGRSTFAHVPGPNGE